LKTVRVVVHLYNTHCIRIVINFLRSGSLSALHHDIFLPLVVFHSPFYFTIIYNVDLNIYDLL